MKKTEKIQIAYLVVYFLALIALVTLILFFPSIYLILSFACVLVIGWFGMYVVQSRIHKFKCNKCGKEFHPSVFKEISNRIFHKGYAHLKCPKCDSAKYEQIDYEG